MPILRTTAELVAWMEDLYLSELVLLSAKPAPKKRVPDEVVVVLGMPDLDHEGARDRFLAFELVATAVERWEADGRLDTDHELTLTLADDAAAPIAVRFHAGATALLACGQVVAEEREPVLRRARPRPWQHQFTMWSDDTTTTGADLLALLQLGPEVRLESCDEPPLRGELEWPLASLHRRTPRAWRIMAGERMLLVTAFQFRGSDPGFTLCVQREEADDALWDRVWALPGSLGVQQVSSRTLRTDPAGWARMPWQRGAKSVRR